MPKTIIRIAAKGDGVTEDGEHFSGTAPGDIIAGDGLVSRGPHYQKAPCRHFGACGGCDLQHIDDAALREFVTQRVVNAAEGQDLVIEELLETHLSPDHSRRRVNLHGAQLHSKGEKGRRGKYQRAKKQKQAAKPLLGYRESRSHKIVDLAQCTVMDPALFTLVPALRNLLGQFEDAKSSDITLTLAGQGVSCSIKGLAPDGLAQTEALLDFARDHSLARLALDDGYGAEIMWEPHPVTVTLGGVAVSFPEGAFLQPTQDGETQLIADAKHYLAGAARIADLFSGLGTFAFALANPAKVLAVEASQPSHLACKKAAERTGKPVHALHRDLFRAPLQADELGRFDAVLLDPPRAGAREQCAEIAGSGNGRVTYISCNPSSWARDAKTLCDAGFKLKTLRAVGQFRWSTHVELTSYFER